MYHKEIRRSTIKFALINLAVIVIGIALVILSLYVVEIGLLRIIGGAVAGGGIIRFVDYWLYRRNKEYGLAEEMIDKWGILDIQEGRGRVEKDQYRDLLLECDDKLHIQAISLTRFQTDLGNVLDKLGKQGVEIRLLLMDPDSDLCHWYGQADPERGDLKKQIIKSTNNLIERDFDSLEVRYYDGLPHNYFRIDSKAFVGPYFIHSPGRSTITFLGETDKDLVREYVENFEELWEQSRAAEKTPV